MNERILSKNEIEYSKLETAARMLESKSPNKAQYVIEDVYLDFGSNWMWTTIIRKGYRECQVLSPRDWENIMLADSFTELEQITDEIRNDKWFGDN